MPQAHHLALVGPARHLQRGGDGPPLHDERVVAAGEEGRRDAGVDATAPVRDRGRLAVHDPEVPHHAPAERLADRLVPEADPEDRQLAAELADPESLLATDQASMFRTVEAPVAPSRPSAPDRGRIKTGTPTSVT